MAAQQKFHSEQTSYFEKKNCSEKGAPQKSNSSEEMAAPKKQLLCESSYFKEVCSFYKK